MHRVRESNQYRPDSDEAPSSDSSTVSRFGGRPDRSRWLPWLGWQYSLLLPLALLLLTITLLAGPNRSPDLLTLAVSNAATGSPVAVARVSIGPDHYMVDEGGNVVVERPGEGTGIVVEADGFGTMNGQVTANTADLQTVALRPSTLAGTVTDATSSAPIAGASLSIKDAAGKTVASAQSDTTGAYRFDNVPEAGTLTVDAGVYGTIEQSLDGTQTRNVAMKLATASGVVMTAAGEPIQGAIVKSGEATSISAGDGTFTLVGVGDGATVNIGASGYAATDVTVANGMVAEVKLEARQIKGLYANWSVLTTPGALDDLIETANTTEINAVVIDIKQDTVYYDSQVAFFRDAGTVNPIMDVGEVIARLREHNIYAIARLVVFQDPLVANARPDLAVKDVSGGLWVNEMGVAWVSAFNEELWDANIALASEAIDLGFDEIQYDYVRFPSDGDLATADFGVDYTAEAREAAITEFMKRSYEAIHARGGKLAADLFGFVTIVDDEQYIGQRFSALEPYLDYVCMMIYPSHFSEGNIASAPGHPNDYPYETIFESLQRAEQNAPGSKAKFRPWLQDFSYGFNGLRDYDADDVRAQIDAAEAFGASGWLLWGDPFNVTVSALKPESGT